MSFFTNIGADPYNTLKHILKPRYDDVRMDFDSRDDNVWVMERFRKAWKRVLSLGTSASDATWDESVGGYVCEVPTIVVTESIIIDPKELINKCIESDIDIFSFKELYYDCIMIHKKASNGVVYNLTPTCRMVDKESNITIDIDQQHNIKIFKLRP